MAEKTKGKGTAVIHVLQRTLTIGTGATDQVKLGGYEAYYSMAIGQSTQLGTLKTDYDKVVATRDGIRRDLKGLDAFIRKPLEVECMELEKSMIAFTSKEVAATTDARQVALDTVGGLQKQATALEGKLAQATAQGALPPHAIDFKVPDVLNTLMSITPTKFSAAADGVKVELWENGAPVAKKLGHGKHHLELIAPATATNRRTAVPVEVMITRPQRVITWDPPQQVEVGQVIDITSLSVTATGDGKAPVLREPAGGAFTKPGRQKITVAAPGGDNYDGHQESVEIEVLGQQCAIRWKKPKELVRGRPYTLKDFDASMVGEGTLTLEPPDANFGFLGEAILTIIATGAKGWRDRQEEATVPVVDPTRTVNWSPRKEIEVGSQLSLDDLQVKADAHGPAAYYEPKGATFTVPALKADLSVVAPGGPGWQTGRQKASVLVFANREITWSPLDKVEGGEPITLAQLGNAIASGEGTIRLEPKDGIFTALETQTLTIIAEGEGPWRTSSKSESILVIPRVRVITWAPPAKIRFGEEITPTLLKAKVNRGAGNLVVTSPKGGVFAEAGEKVTVTIEAPAVGVDGAAPPLTKEVTILKGKPQIAWKPEALAVDGKLSGKQLNAVLQPKGIVAPIKYTPALHAQISKAGTAYLRAEVEETDNFEGAEREVRLAVFANETTKKGFEDGRSGKTWNQPQDAASQRLLKAWDDDDGSDPEGVKTQGQAIMRDIQALTADETIAYMDKLTPTGDRRSTNGDFPNQIWKFDNGLQVRYKSNGDLRHQGTPMFCVEVRKTYGFGTNPDDYAFKISADGTPSSVGARPGEIAIPDGTPVSDYQDGICEATHLQCRPKLEQRIKWKVLPPRTDAQELTADELNAVLEVGEGEIKYFVGDVEVQVGDRLTANKTPIELVAEAAETARYKKARRSSPTLVIPAPEPKEDEPKTT